MGLRMYEFVKEVKRIFMDIKQRNELALKKHEMWKGKIEVISRAEVNNSEDLANAYTPGVAAPCLEIQKNENLAYKYTRKGNLVAVITNGTAVLGLGDIGPQAGMPVMEGKCCLFKKFANVDAIPILVDSHDKEEVIKTIKNISKSFGAINLEDIKAPECFEIETRLKEICDIPIFHDDQHGTAIVLCAAMINCSRLMKRPLSSYKVTISGAGAAGISIAKLLVKLGIGDVILCDKFGILYRGNPQMNPYQKEVAEITNKQNIQGTLADAMKGADVFVGVSVANIVSQDMVRAMAPQPIVISIANPIPEIMPQDAKEAGAYIIATGRSDFPNQVNNVLAFPGLFKGILSVNGTKITEEMKVAAAHGLAQIISDQELNPEYILPNAFNPKVVESVSNAVATEAVKNNLIKKM